jgi:hypothetical protein
LKMDRWITLHLDQDEPMRFCATCNRSCATMHYECRKYGTKLAAISWESAEQGHMPCGKASANNVTEAHDIAQPAFGISVSTYNFVICNHVMLSFAMSQCQLHLVSYKFLPRSHNIDTRFAISQQTSNPFACQMAEP